MTPFIRMLSSLRLLFGFRTTLLFPSSLPMTVQITGGKPFDLFYHIVIKSTIFNMKFLETETNNDKSLTIYKPS